MSARRRTPPPVVEQRGRLGRLLRTIGVFGGTAVVVGVLAVGVFPTRTWLDQRDATADAQSRLEILREQNESFEARIARLDSDEEIERIAREQFNLVKPGEEEYIVLPPPQPPVDLPDLWPFGSIDTEP